MHCLLLGVLPDVEDDAQITVELLLQLLLLLLLLFLLLLLVSSSAVKHATRIKAKMLQVQKQKHKLNADMWHKKPEQQHEF